MEFNRENRNGDRIHTETGRTIVPNVRVETAGGTRITSWDRDPSPGGRESTFETPDGRVTLRAGGTDGTSAGGTIGAHSLSVSDSQISYTNRDIGGVSYDGQTGRVTVSQGDQRRSYSPGEFAEAVRAEATTALAREGAGFVRDSLINYLNRDRPRDRDNRRSDRDRDNGNRRSDRDRDNGNRRSDRDRDNRRRHRSDR